VQRPKQGKPRSRPDYRLSPTQVAPGEAVIKDGVGVEIRRVLVSREMPDPADYGMVQIAPEPEPLTEYQRFVQWRREQEVMNFVYRIGAGVIRPVVPR
jgi:hypothetical protein